MPTPYTEDCISLTGVFHEPIGYPIYTDHNLLMPHAHAFGMDAKELMLALFNQGNYIYLQPEVYELLQGDDHAFIPPDDYAQDLGDLYEEDEPQLEDRARVKIKSGALEYRFIYSEPSIARSPIFLRHPITGIVTKHEHPYPAFPRIKFRSADPAILTSKAASKEILWGSLFSQTNITSEPLERCYWLMKYASMKRDRGCFSEHQSLSPISQPPQITHSSLPSVCSPVFQMSPGRRQCEAEAREHAWTRDSERRMNLSGSSSRIDSESPSPFSDRPKPIPRRRRKSVAPRPSPRRNPSRAAKTKSSDANAALFTRRRRRIV
ncbi:hypothetical protein CYLTODRAFT_458351 [Cylindrobasidium torrendii FP15055 ss-10]|uniref:Uncharacterized protein n=1 Tax=Cylindrobasidium torrendii FP15055 ss-10 TaxID=1314674 RepID=A0A0D7AZ79_9AGAR|nr:hypothetical protein CYLTODRAFT_458351 [Cylindrobasidium torrendii FP15055 ss-10]